MLEAEGIEMVQKETLGIVEAVLESLLPTAAWSHS
jgi:hypothetical protein